MHLQGAFFVLWGGYGVLAITWASSGVKNQLIIQLLRRVCQKSNKTTFGSARIVWVLSHPPFICKDNSELLLMLAKVAYSFRTEWRKSLLVEGKIPKNYNSCHKNRFHTLYIWRHFLKWTQFINDLSFASESSYRKITCFAREVNGQMSYYLSNKAIH